MIDTHCHLDMSAFEGDLEEVLKRAKSARVDYIITVGADLKASLSAIEIAKAHEQVFASVGLHPHDASQLDDATLQTLRRLIEQRHENKVVALGEIGLDYHYNYSPPSVQRQVFESLLSLAVEQDIPVIIHNRQADEDTKAIIEASGIKKALFHCFSSGRSMAEWVIDRGFYVSFAGNLTFKKANQLRELSAWIPDDRLMIETDAPYLAPEPFRGKRNEPAFIEHTAKKLAEIRGVSLEDIDRMTTVNAMNYFRIGSLPSSAIVYKIRDNLYINLTSDCTNACCFCIKFDTDFVKGHNLRLTQEPSVDEIIKAIGDPKRYREVVFCGLGEPTLRLDVIKETARWIKSQGGRVRLNTNGLGNAINGRDIIPELVGLVDSISISLNAQDSETYNRLCRPSMNNAYEEVLSFIKKAVRSIKEVTVTVVETKGIDIEKCKALAEGLGANFRVRRLNVVG